MTNFIIASKSIPFLERFALSIQLNLSEQLAIIIKKIMMSKGKNIFSFEFFSERDALVVSNDFFCSCAKRKNISEEKAKKNI